MRPSFSLGIEEEHQSGDPVTRDLRSHIQTEMLAQGKLRQRFERPACRHSATRKNPRKIHSRCEANRWRASSTLVL